MKILVRGVNWLGDAVMTTPALLRLRAAFPAATISLLTPEKLAGLWDHHPALDDILTFGPRQSPWEVGQSLRGRKFDLGLIFPNSFRSALEIWTGGIPRRIGYAGGWRQCLLTQPVRPRTGVVVPRKRSRREVRKRAAARLPLPEEQTSARPVEGHHLHQYLHLLTALGINSGTVEPSLSATPAEQEKVCRDFGLSRNAPLMALHAGAEYGPAKRWPVERFAAVANELHRRAPSRWVLLGGLGEARLVAELLAHLAPEVRAAALNLAGQTSLSELRAVLSVCQILITNDTGPMHVAAALGTPVVAIFGSTSPTWTGPRGRNAAGIAVLYAGVSCAPCLRRECPIDFRCMLQMAVPDVVAAAVERLKAEG